MSESKIVHETATQRHQESYGLSTQDSRKHRRWTTILPIVIIAVLSLLSLIKEDSELRQYTPAFEDTSRTTSSLSHERNILGTSYPIGSNYIFGRGTSNVCTLIQNITGVEILGKDEPSYIATKTPPPIVNLTLNCEQLTGHTGNWIYVIYHMRLAAALGRVDFQFQCSSGMASVENSIWPWFSGYYPAPSTSTWPYDLGWPDPNLVCANEWSKLPLQHFAHEIQHDMRRIAVAMLGPRDHVVGTTTGLMDVDRLIHSIPSKFLNQSGMKVDDAAIHFRCGDVFGFTGKPYYGVIQFREYVKRIPKATTRTIGIHTQPFDQSLLRSYDKRGARPCKRVVGEFVGYLKEEYPNVKITVRNTRRDTVPLTYARLIMAAQTITSTSTFGIFPSIGTFGEGYFQWNDNVNTFAANISDLLPNVHPIDAPMMSSPEIKEAGVKGTIEFLMEKP